MKFLIAMFLITINAQAAHFKTGSDVPTAELNQELIRVYREEMKDLPKDTLISIEGHTDSRGSDSYNKQLSEKRAQAVVEFFKHLHFTNISAVGLGESQLADAGDSLESHAKNRRVVIVFNGGKTVISEAKECKPKIVEKVVYKNKTIKNIISLKAINSYQDPFKRVSGNRGTVGISRETTLGVQYQRNVGSNVFVGAEVDMNESVGVLLGVGF